MLNNQRPHLCSSELRQCCSPATPQHCATLGQVNATVMVTGMKLNTLTDDPNQIETQQEISKELEPVTVWRNRINPVDASIESL